MNFIADTVNWKRVERVTPVINQKGKDICLINALNGVCESIWMIDDKSFNKDSLIKEPKDYCLSTKEFMDNVFSVVPLTEEEKKIQPWDEEEFQEKFRKLNMERAFEYVSRVGVSMERDCPFGDGNNKYDVYSRKRPSNVLWLKDIQCQIEKWPEPTVNYLLGSHPLIGGLKTYKSFGELVNQRENDIYRGPTAFELEMEIEVKRRKSLLQLAHIKTDDTPEQRDLRRFCELWEPFLHAILIVGYGVSFEPGQLDLNYFIIRNSYDVNWGHKGYLRVERSVISHLAYPTEVYYPVEVSIQ